MDDGISRPSLGFSSFMTTGGASVDFCRKSSGTPQRTPHALSGLVTISAFSSIMGGLVTTAALFSILGGLVTTAALTSDIPLGILSPVSFAIKEEDTSLVEVRPSLSCCAMNKENVSARVAMASRRESGTSDVQETSEWSCGDGATCTGPILNHNNPNIVHKII
ncbi:MAG: hypothetical protein AAFY26_25250 [Cyanobacteria bacterium J06638_22]